MTNSNDFRKYSYQYDPAYLINSFDYQRSSQAPALKPEAQPKRPFRVHENKEIKSAADIKKEQKLSAKKAIRIVIVAVFSLAMIGLVINSLAVKNQLTKEIAVQETKIANAQSENISLQSQLDSLVSMSMIDEYAVEKLGMTKVKSSQIQYMDVSEYKAKNMEKMRKSNPMQTAKQLTDLSNK